MADLPTRSFSVIVQTVAVGIQGRASALIDLSVGSPLRAIAESIAAVSLWLQALALQIMKVARLSTSGGIDVDTFVADFMPGMSGSPITLPNGSPSPRLPQSNATGPVTFVRFTAPTTPPTSPFIPVGATVRTNDGSQTVSVLADAANTNFSPKLNGYLMPPTGTSLTVSAEALTPGPVGNITAGTATSLTTPLVGIDQVSNSLAFVGGQLAETDVALKVRFVLFILGLSRGNIYGVEFALASLNVAIAYTITDLKTYAGVSQPGFFYVVVDDGSGTPSSPFLLAATEAVNRVKPLGVNFSVFSPVVIGANVNLSVATIAGYDHTAVINQILALITANIIALGLGAGLDVYTIADWAKSIPGVAPTSGVTALTLNGLSGDAATIAANGQNRIMPGTITVS